jgi:hypothetical protein
VTVIVKLAAADAVLPSFDPADLSFVIVHFGAGACQDLLAGDLAAGEWPVLVRHGHTGRAACAPAARRHGRTPRDRRVRRLCGNVSRSQRAKPTTSGQTRNPMSGKP